MVKTCDVLYIHSTKNPTGEDYLNFSLMPMGILGILNKLKAGNIDVLGLNFAIEKTLDPQFDIPSALGSIRYKVLLTDLHWYEHAYGAMYIVEESKKLYPEIPTVIGGYTSTIYAQEIMENFGAVDYVVTGDSDLPVELLVDNLLGRREISPEDIPNLVYRRGGEILTAKETWVQTSLDDIDFVHTDYFEHKEYVPRLGLNGLNARSTGHWLCIARGCKFNCAYCCGANANMQTLFRRCNILLRSPEKVADDFCQLTDMGIMKVSPSHDFQMFGKDYYRAVFSGIRERNGKPGMYLECFQLPTKDYIDDIAQTFDTRRLVLVISPISGNETLRRENGKHFTNDALYETVRYIMDKGIALQLYYTLNPVGETKEQFFDTVFQMKYLHLAMGLGGNQVIYQRVVIDPLAPMREHENIQVAYNTFMDYYRYCQIPSSQKNMATGFADGGQVPVERKVQMYDSIFR